MLTLVALLLILLGLIVFWLGRRSQAEAGLPGGRVIYSDTRGWQSIEKPLFSRMHRLTGKPDYLVQQGRDIVPVEVKSAPAPGRRPAPQPCTATGRLLPAGRGDLSLDVAALFLDLSVAAILGDTANYQIGKYIGPHAFTGKVRFLKRDYLDRTHAFYEKYGAKTIVIARFVPIVRTFAPFVAGIGYMSYLKFLTYNVVGGVAWVAVCVFAGYGFGNIPVIKRNFSLVILAIIFVSILPMVFEYWKARRASAGRV